MKNYYFKNRSSLMLINYQCGLLIKYEEDNNIQSFNGLLNNKCIMYHSNGYKGLVAIYRNGLQHGDEIFYYTNGKIDYICEYKNGKLTDMYYY